MKISIDNFTIDELAKHLEPGFDRIKNNFFNNHAVFVTKQDIIRNDLKADIWITFRFLYRVTHFNHDNVHDQSSIYVRMQKKVRKNYDGIFSFGDPQGGTFVVVSTHHIQSKAYMKYKSVDCAIGVPFAIINPTITGGVMRTDMFIVETSQPFIPLRQDITQRIPRCPPIDPTVQETTFFMLENQQLKVQGQTLIGKGDIIPTSCAGLFCDRMHRFKSQNEACGCFHRATTGNTSAIVLEMKIDVVPYDTRLHSDYHRSFRFTQLLMTNIEALSQSAKDDRDDYKLLCIDRVRNCIDYINNHGGFTLLGTITRGSQQDASGNAPGNQGNSIEAQNTKTHFCYIYPTRRFIAERDEYKRLRLDPRIKPVHLLDSDEDSNDDDDDNDEQNNEKPASRPTTSKKSKKKKGSCVEGVETASRSATTITGTD